MRISLSLTILAAAGFGFAQTSITDALRKGIIEEEVNKNLPAAIKQYSAVVQRFDEERKLFAPNGEASAAVRESYRKLLAMQSEYAEKNYQAQLLRYKLGSGQQIDVVRGSRAYVEADLRIAAFEAGLTGSSGSPAGRDFSGSPETRLGAATALYRMAECYRKTGKIEQANAAYARVISELPERGELVNQSRAKLPADFRAPSTPQQEAFATIGDLLAKYAASSKQYLNYCTQQYELGAISVLDLYLPQLELAEAESRMAAWKAGEFDLALRPVTLSLTAGQEPPPASIGRASSKWPRAELDIKKDIVRVEKQLKELESQPNSAQYRALKFQIQELQFELEAAHK